MSDRPSRLRDGWSAVVSAPAGRPATNAFMRTLLLALALMATPAFASVSEGLQKWSEGDWAGAVGEWNGPAARGDSEALFHMGQAYRLGRGVEQSTDTALDYYRRAAARGHVGATANLGITLWQLGRRTEALGHLRTAADRGDLRAAYVLGTATFAGDGAPRNPVLGYAYLVRARDGGLAIASAQTARVATLLTPEERARGEATAAALAGGRPTAVAMASPAPAPARQADPPAARASAPVSRPPARSAARAEPAPAPAPEVQAETPEEAQDGRFRVQLGAYTSESAARTAWATLVSQSASLLKGLTPVYAPRSGLVRLQVGPFAERVEATDLCARLAASGRPCFVTSG